MENINNFMPMLEVAAFKNKKAMRRAIKEDQGVEEEINGDFLCISYQNDEYCRVKSFILVKGFDGNAEHLSILAHECSHAVDNWFERMGEKTPGTEIRAYAMQAAMMASLEQLMD